MILALLGFITSLLVHLSTFAGFNPGAFGGVWGLHIGIFVVFIPAMVCTNNALKGHNKRDYWKIALSHAPTWLRAMCGLFFAYAFFNFFFTIFVLLKGGTPGIIDGQYVLHDHGEIIRQLTEAEYIRHQAYTIRLFSGHWMIFYLTSFATLLSRRLRRLERRGAAAHQGRRRSRQRPSDRRRDPSHRERRPRRRRHQDIGGQEAPRADPRRLNPVSFAAE